MLLVLESTPTHFPWLFPAFFFIVGACIGSFLNVCIYRIPTGASIVQPRSHCVCGQLIAWHDNIPILSWFLLRGRARCCGRPFSIRYPFVEALTGALFLLCWLIFSPAKAIAGMVFCAILIGAVFIDLDHMIIPDGFTVGGFVVGLALAFAFPSLHHNIGGVPLLENLRSLTTALVGALIGSALILWIGLLAETILRKEAMGFGDVKFLGVLGAFCGWQGAIFAIFGGAMIGTLSVILTLLWGSLMRGVFPRRKDSKNNFEAKATEVQETHPSMSEEKETPITLLGRHVPFGPLLAVASLLYFFFLAPAVDAYFGNITHLLFRP